jgi:hypothetical protein
MIIVHVNNLAPLKYRSNEKTSRDQTTFEILMNLPGVSRVDTTARTHDLGRFYVSTMNDTYLARGSDDSGVDIK